jgi:hypothetical protein
MVILKSDRLILPMMMLEIEILVLKGLDILAQGNPGKTGSRPGLKKENEIRPRNNV